MTLCISSYLSLVESNPIAFHHWLLSVYSWVLVLQAGDPTLGFRSHTSQGDPTNCLIIPLVLRAPTQPSYISTALLSSQVVLKLVLLSVRCYKALVSLLSSSLFQLPSPQFSCNYRLAQEGGLCDFHSLLFCLLPPHFSS